MAHKRAAIRQFAAALLAPLPSIGGNFTVGRAFPEVVEQLPMLDLKTSADELDDTQSTAGVGNYIQSRLLDLELTIYAAGDNFLDTLDQISLEAETALMADPLFGGLTDWIEFDTMELELTGEVESPVAQMILVFQVRYQVDAQDPQ